MAGIRRRFEDTFPHGLVTGYTIDQSRAYPDIGDAHVHCAAVHGGADILLTRNVRDFPETDDLPYEVYTPDDFFVLVDDSAPTVVRDVAEQQLRYYMRKSKTRSVGLERMLRAAGAPNFADRVRQHLGTVDVNVVLSDLQHLS